MSSKERNVLGSVRVSDVELISKYRNGDETAFIAIYDRYRDLLYDLVFCIIKGEEDTEDILQDVFVNFWRARKNIYNQYNRGAEYSLDITYNLF